MSLNTGSSIKQKKYDTKNINNAKNQHTINTLKQSRNKWKTVKNINKNNKQHPPNKIKYNNEIITSPKTISNIANNYFKDKIIKIRNLMDKPKYNPINLLSKLIKPIKYNTKIKPITRKQTLKLIDKLNI